MLTGILLIFVGVWLNAPTWYFVLCGLLLFSSLIGYGMKMYRAGRGEP